MASKWTAAMALLGVLVVFGAAGTLALDAAQTDATETRTESAAIADSSPPVLETGEQVSGFFAGSLPLFAYAAVPMGILGILTLGGAALTRSIRSTGRMGR
jgi:hypothetical protein